MLRATTQSTLGFTPFQIASLLCTVTRSFSTELPFASIGNNVDAVRRYDSPVLPSKTAAGMCCVSIDMGLFGWPTRLCGRWRAPPRPSRRQLRARSTQPAIHSRCR